MPELSLAESRRGDVVVLAIAGSLNTQTSARFEGKLLELLKAGQRLFVIDLTSVDYVASAALRVLLMVAKRLGAGGGQVALAGLNPEVRKVFQISGFDRDFRICPTADEALAQVASAPRAAAPAPRPVADASPPPPAPRPNAEPGPPPPLPMPVAESSPPPDPLVDLAARLRARLAAPRRPPAADVPEALATAVRHGVARARA